MTGLRRRVQSGARCIGLFVTIPSPIVVEIAAASGADFVCIDQEHGTVSPGQLENMLRAADLGRVPALVRVQGVDPMAIATALDCGAEGVLVPRVNSAHEARQAVAAARFPPEGRRGAGPGRSSGYGRDIPAGIARARESTLVAVQIETVEGMEAAPEIVAVPGIDLVFVGPGDLSVCLGAAGRGGETEAAITRIRDAAAAAGLPSGIFCMTRADAETRIGEGFALAACGSDVSHLIAVLDATFRPG
ncbi:MAG: HpcH/HpaI aldolase family protein [Gemmobacter sp.]